MLPAIGHEVLEALLLVELLLVELLLVELLLVELLLVELLLVELLLVELLLEDCLFHCCHTSLLPLLTQIYLTLGVSPKLPILEQAPPSLGVAAFAWVIASGEVRRMKQARIESLRM